MDLLFILIMSVLSFILINLLMPNNTEGVKEAIKEKEEGIKGNERWTPWGIPKTTIKSKRFFG